MIIMNIFKKLIYMLSTPIISNDEWNVQIINEFRISINNLTNILTTKVNVIVDDTKIDKLKKNGFINSKNIVDNNRIKNDFDQELYDVVYYFSHYKYDFITPSALQDICKKFNLVVDKVQKYNGFISDTVLENVDNFVIADYDTCYQQSSSLGGGFVSKPEIIKGFNYDYHGIEVVGVKGDFATKTSSIYQLNNPIILMPVSYQKKKYYLIVA